MCSSDLAVANWKMPVRVTLDPAEKLAAFRAARAALAASGTVTLELAVAGIPTVLSYKISFLEEIVGHLFVGKRTIGLSNLVLGEVVMPEVLQHDATPENLASMAGIVSARNSIVYSGIKAGIMGITRAAAAELGARKIRVNAVAPSAVPTEGTQRNRNVERDAQRVARTPLGRLGTVDDIAGVVCFLAGDDSGFLTGQTIAADGGYTTANLLG